jgi:hypothetical protein
MASAMLPVGTQSTKKLRNVRPGDVLLLVTGDKVVYEDMRRTKFTGKYLATGKGVIVPVYRDRSGTTPFIVDIVDFKEPEKKPTIASAKMKFGELFGLEGNHKEVFMYVGLSSKRGKAVIKGIDLKSKRVFNIDPSFTLVKVDIKTITDLAKIELTKI